MARPYKYSVDEMEQKINEFFYELENKEGKINPPTLYDLSDYLEIDRSTLFRYEKRDGYAKIMKRAKNSIISWWVRQLAIPGRPTTGVIFYLKNVAGWADRVEHQHSGSIEHQHKPKLDDLSQDKLEKLAAALDDIEDEDVIDVTPDD